MVQSSGQLVAFIVNPSDVCFGLGSHSDSPRPEVYGGTFEDESFDLSHDAPGPRCPVWRERGMGSQASCFEEVLQSPNGPSKCLQQSVFTSKSLFLKKVFTNRHHPLGPGNGMDPKSTSEMKGGVPHTGLAPPGLLSMANRGPNTNSCRPKRRRHVCGTGLLAKKWIRNFMEFLPHLLLKRLAHSS